MAAASASERGPVRVRLLFDYPPPGSPACGQCWLLLEPGQARFVTDLSSLIRDKFGFSRRAKLSLFLDGALLPPTESARLVRDNDSLRVKLEEIIGRDGYDETTNGFRNPLKKEKKRQRQKLEAEDSKSEDEEYRGKKKSKRNLEHFSSQEENSANNQAHKKSKKKREKVTKRDCVTDSKSDDSTIHSSKLNNRVSQAKEQETENKYKNQKRTLEANKSQKTLTVIKNSVAKPSTKEGGTSSESFTSSDSDGNVAHGEQMLLHKTKVATQHVQKSQLADSSVKPISVCKLATKPKDGNPPKLANSKEAKGQSSSSDSDSSSGKEEEPWGSNLKCKTKCNKQGAVTGLTSKTKPETSSSETDSSESETCTAKGTKTNTVLGQSFKGNSGKKLPATTCGLATSSGDAGRGRGRGEITFWRGPRVRGCHGMGRGRGRGESSFFFNYNGEYQKQKQLNEAATNTSVIIQNSPELPKKDYSVLPLLAAPPQVGEKIAFKLLELTENYSPEVSNYKEGKITSWNPTNKQVEIEILSFSAVAKEPGKFDLIYQSADGAETIEYAVSQDKKITESWDALIEPRLIVDPSHSEASTKNGNP